MGLKTWNSLSYFKTKQRFMLTAPYTALERTIGDRVKLMYFVSCIMQSLLNCTEANVNSQLDDEFSVI